MSIKERLVRIMNSEGLNASLFADRIGVQRSSISHILSGRNKPSLDFLEKILGAYPKYNAEWLVMGTGQVYKAPKQSSLFDVPTDKASEEDTMDKNVQSVEKNNDFQHANISNDETLNLYGKNSEIKKSEKAIEKVLIFYTDGTFSAYRPNN
ncbi:MAG: XRE family transcriptional regulator [Bacteroidetes bacterium HGW-Bacteroidetes-4]|jgi:transcriptional regulator with XRE-family HTH domain|nr:MAG: XRE family transcriptional regulator [Bacteroidetes bacterium HGW-Bacteroidetes-4]